MLFKKHLQNYFIQKKLSEILRKSAYFMFAKMQRQPHILCITAISMHNFSFILKKSALKFSTKVRTFCFLKFQNRFDKLLYHSTTANKNHSVKNHAHDRKLLMHS